MKKSFYSRDFVLASCAYFFVFLSIGIDMTRKYMQLADVRKIMGATKKDAV